jgi:hypothetical protein
VCEIVLLGGIKSVLWSQSRKEPKLLARAGAGAGKVKFRLRLQLLAPGQTRVVYKSHYS